MISAKRLNQQKSKTEGRTFLKYSDLPFGTRRLVVRVIEIRETPRLNSPCAIDIANSIEVDGDMQPTEATSIPVNLTNMKKLAELVGDDLTAARGMMLGFSFSLKNNPNARPGDNTETMGFDLMTAELPGAKRPEPEPEPANKRRGSR